MPLLIHPVPPYDFSLSCSFFSGRDPAFRKFQQNVFSQVIRIRGEPIIIVSGRLERRAMQSLQSMLSLEGSHVKLLKKT